MSNVQFYGSFAKVDREQRTVSGYASTETVDEAGETILKSGIEEALADYMKFANIREMHESSAVGVATEAFMDDRGLYITAKVIDRDAWEKVKEGVYKGFSIGGRVMKRSNEDRRIIEKLRLCEISLVDRPCNPEAVFDVWKAADIGEDMDTEYQLWIDSLAEIAKAATAEDGIADAVDHFAKRDFNAAERKKDAKSGAAMKDGSFPIENGKDLENAIRLAGKAKDPAAARAHIKRRAAALGLSDKIPDSWKSVDAEQIGGEDKTAEAVEKADVGAPETDADRSKGPKKDDLGDKEDEDDADHTPEMNPDEPAVKVESAESAEDPIAKNEALLSAIEASEKPVEQVEKSADEMMAELNDMISGLNAKIDQFEATIAQNAVEKAALEEQIESLTKVASEKEEALSGKEESLAKLAERNSSAIELLSKRLDEQKEAFEKRLEEVRKEAMTMPLPPKTLGPGAGIAGVVEKGSDAAGTPADRGTALSDEEVQKALASMTDQDRALALIKATHKFPRQISAR